MAIVNDSDRKNRNSEGSLTISLLIRAGEDVGLAGIELACHSLDDPVADVGTHPAFQSEDQKMNRTGICLI
jgi:hypothetical protein